MWSAGWSTMLASPQFAWRTAWRRSLLATGTFRFSPNCELRIPSPQVHELESISVPARLMDAGKNLFLEVAAVKDYDDYLDIAVQLYMADY